MPAVDFTLITVSDFVVQLKGLPLCHLRRTAFFYKKAIEVAFRPIFQILVST
jgi:hypothetical protein